MYGLINLASKQLLPNVLATLALARSGLLGADVTFHTRNENESALPALQLSDLLADIPGAGPELPGFIEEVDGNASDVYEAALSLLNEGQFSGLTWVLNATGGNKLMSAGLMALSGHPRVAAVIYRDIETGWVQFSRCRSTGAPMQAPVDSAKAFGAALLASDLALDQVPLARLISAQFAGRDAQFSDTPLPRQPNLTHLALHGCKWPGQFRHFKGWQQERPPSEGLAFEALVALLLRAAGCAQVLWSVTVKGPSGVLLESDVLACHGSQLALYDIKLSDSKGKSEQIRNARKTADMLAGVSAKAVLVRPNWASSTDLGNYATALKVQLLRRDEVSQFVTCLIKPLGLDGPLNPSLLEIQQAFARRAAASDKTVFPHG